MKYKDFEFFCNSFYAEAYGLYPETAKNANQDFQVSIGLLINKVREYIPFAYQSGFTFGTQDVMPKGVKFKIAVRNESECYVYVIGQETDGSSYVLFPYTEKHSPYCGIVGTRLFPKDYSLQLDDVGQKDVMAVLFSKEKLDYQALNEQISKSKASSYEAKIKEVLGSKLMTNVKFVAGQTISFKGSTAGKSVVAMVFEMKKK
jgi:coproporphyrinogen III oxidase-like Fe-S oxidoreductase